MKRLFRWLKSGRFRDTKLETFTWLFLIASLAADWMNMAKLRGCFIVWVATSLFWALVDYKKKIYAQAILGIILAITSVVGFIWWGFE